MFVNGAPLELDKSNSGITAILQIHLWCNDTSVHPSHNPSQYNCRMTDTMPHIPDEIGPGMSSQWQSPYLDPSPADSAPKRYSNDRDVWTKAEIANLQRHTTTLYISSWTIYISLVTYDQHFYLLLFNNSCYICAFCEIYATHTHKNTMSY